MHGLPDQLPDVLTALFPVRGIPSLLIRSSLGLLTCVHACCQESRLTFPFQTDPCCCLAQNSSVKEFTWQLNVTALRQYHPAAQLHPLIARTDAWSWVLHLESMLVKMLGFFPQHLQSAHMVLHGPRDGKHFMLGSNNVPVHLLLRLMYFLREPQSDKNILLN